MSTTLKGLRARTTRAFEAARKVPQGIGKPRFQDLNMRQAWVENQKVIIPFLDLGKPASMVVPAALVAFHLEGEIYYHAKKHGTQSAMLFKLQRI